MNLPFTPLQKVFEEVITLKGRLLQAYAHTGSSIVVKA
jgi:hypothetical protein